MTSRSWRVSRFPHPYDRIYLRSNWQNVELFAVLASSRNQIYKEYPPWWERVECYHTLSVPTPPVLAYYSNAVSRNQPDAGVVLHVAALEFVTWALMHFLATAEKVSVRYECNNPQMGSRGCRVLVPLPSEVRRRIDHHSFSLLVTGFTFDFALAYLAYRCSAEMDWSPLSQPDRWLSSNLLTDKCMR